jgi:hypothetical protein
VHDLRADVASAGRAAHPARPPVIVPVRWPEEADRRQELADGGIPRLLLVAAGAAPPTHWAVDEDWISETAPRDERAHRERTLRQRLALLEAPTVGSGPAVAMDEDGLVRRGGRWVALSELEVRLLGPLLANAGHCVSRVTLLEAGWPGEERSSRSVDGGIRRLRAKLRGLGVLVHGITGVGYLLEVGPNPVG